MFERFTHRARKVMAMANREAQRFYHKQIRTEHVLMAIVKLGSGAGARVLENLARDDLRHIKSEIEKRIVPGPEEIWQGKLPQTLQVKKMIDHAIEEARNLNHNYIGTEHLVLGLLSESESKSVAAQVLMSQGLKLDDVRNKVKDVVGHDTTARDAGSRYPMMNRMYGAQIDSEVSTRTEALLRKCLNALRWAVGLITTGGLLLLIVNVITPISGGVAHAVWISLLLLFVLIAWLVLVITILQIERYLRNQGSGHNSSGKRKPDSNATKPCRHRSMTSAQADTPEPGKRPIGRHSSDRGDLS